MRRLLIVAPLAALLLTGMKGFTTTLATIDDLP